METLPVKLLRDVEKFLEAYKILPPEGRAQFEAQIAAKIEKSDPQSRCYYQVLMTAARNGLDAKAAIAQLNKANY